MQIVTHYGIHWATPQVSFLEQGRGGSNALGLKEKSPFKVQLPLKSKPCNHLIALATPNPAGPHLDWLVKLKDDPFFRAMMPIPKTGDGLFYLVDAETKYLPYYVMLSRMSSPIYPVVLPIWAMGLSQIMQEMHMTNVQPLVLTDCRPNNTDTIGQIAKVAHYQPRPVICIGNDSVPLPPMMKKIETTLHQYDVNELSMLPWENLGAVLVRGFMRREWKDGWLTKLPLPGNEPKPPRPMPGIVRT